MGANHHVYSWTFCGKYYNRAYNLISETTFYALNIPSLKGKLNGSIDTFHLLFSLRRVHIAFNTTKRTVMN